LDFDHEWALLNRKLRRRAMLRGAILGFTFGAALAATILAAFAMDAGFAQTVGSWIPPEWGVAEVDPTAGAAAPPSPFHTEYGWVWPWPLWALPLFGMLIGMAAGRMVKVGQASAAAWADQLGEGRDVVRTALAGSPGAFSREVKARAAKAVRQARTTNPPLVGSVRWVGVSACVLVVGAAAHGWWAYYLPPPPSARPPATMLDAAVSLMNAFPGNMQQLSKWGSALGLNDVAAAANAADGAMKLLGNAAATPGDALAQLADVEEKARGIAGSASARETLEQLVQSPQAIEIGKQLMEKFADGGSASALEDLDPKALEQLSKALGAGGFGGDGPAPNPGRPGSPPKGQESSSLLSGLGKLLESSPLAKGLFGGGVQREQVDTALRASREMERNAKRAREEILAGNKAPSVPNDKESVSFAQLLKDLPEAPVRKMEQGDLAVLERKGPGVATTGRQLTTTTNDYYSRGNRLPRDARDAAGRYFAGSR